MRKTDSETDGKKKIWTESIAAIVYQTLNWTMHGRKLPGVGKQTRRPSRGMFRLRHQAKMCLGREKPLARADLQGACKLR